MSYSEISPKPFWLLKPLSLPQLWGGRQALLLFSSSAYPFGNQLVFVSPSCLPGEDPPPPHVLSSFFLHFLFPFPFGQKGGNERSLLTDEEATRGVDSKVLL